ncbi:hypothetical protein LEP1GSC027_4355 [Leptospira interrogans str. 2002000624]|nr:hypothetical protein LEP1GSC027_4355 [Leptospira interrogans str. 2002000624]
MLHSRLLDRYSMVRDLLSSNFSRIQFRKDSSEIFFGSSQ